MLSNLNIAVLYDDQATHISTVYEHLASFRKYSKHNIYYLPASQYTPLAKTKQSIGNTVNLSMFDVLIEHYSIRLSLPDHLDEVLAQQIASFDGLKILFIQDEYDTTNTARAWLDRLQYDIVYTCVPKEWRDMIYPQARYPKTRFLSTLTGYMPEDSSLDSFAMPIEKRTLRIGYRGRVLPYHYGMLGYEKYIIGYEMKRLTEEASVPADIEVCDQTKRINGLDWYRFLGSCRGSLGTESGSNVFDDDGLIRAGVEKYLQHSPNASFHDVYEEIVRPHEGPVQMNQVSPKIFECIRLRTALILFRGSYSGVVQPDIHYIPLEKDFSNVKDVFAKLEDVDFLKELTDNAYKDVVVSNKYSYRKFVEGVDADIEEHHKAPPKYELFSTPVAIRDKEGNVSNTFPSNPAGFCLSTGILKQGFDNSSLTYSVAKKLLAGTIPNQKAVVHHVRTIPMVRLKQSFVRPIALVFLRQMGNPLISPITRKFIPARYHHLMTRTPRG